MIERFYFFQRFYCSASVGLSNMASCKKVSALEKEQVQVRLSMNISQSVTCNSSRMEKFSVGYGYISLMTTGNLGRVEWNA